MKPVDTFDHHHHHHHPALVVKIYIAAPKLQENKRVGQFNKYIKMRVYFSKVSGERTTCCATLHIHTFRSAPFPVFYCGVDDGGMNASPPPRGTPSRSLCSA